MKRNVQERLQRMARWLSPSQGGIRRAFVAVCLLSLMGVGFLRALPVLGQTPDEPVTNADTDYTLTWWSVDGGGSSSVSSGDYTLSSTAGQHDADIVTGGDYTLSGGFWGGGGLEPTYRIYLPVIARASS